MPSDVRDRAYWIRRVMAQYGETGLPAVRVEGEKPADRAARVRRDRLDFASEVLRRPDDFRVSSFNDLEDRELVRLSVALDGWRIVQELRRQRGLIRRPRGEGVIR